MFELLVQLQQENEDLKAKIEHLEKLLLYTPVIINPSKDN
jgi:cell division septum initiation protein DivIVA